MFLLTNPQYKNKVIYLADGRFGGSSTYLQVKKFTAIGLFLKIKFIFQNLKCTFYVFLQQITNIRFSPQIVSEGRCALPALLQNELPFGKEREKECLFTIFVYLLNISYTFKLKSAFENQKCSLKKVRSALFLFSTPCPFLSLRETL